MKSDFMKYKYVLDSYAWAEFFDGSEKGKRVKELLKENTATSILVLAEFSDKFTREGREIQPFLEFIQANTAILPLTQEIALSSGKLKFELRKTSKNISLADSMHFQTAKENEATFVTGDNDFREVKGILFL